MSLISGCHGNWTTIVSKILLFKVICEAQHGGKELGLKRPNIPKRPITNIKGQKRKHTT